MGHSIRSFGRAAGVVVLGTLALRPSPGVCQRLASNGIYSVAVAETGAYTAKTGPTHPGPVGVNVLYYGFNNTPWSSYNSIRSYDSNREFYLMTPRPLTPAPTPSAGFTCQNVNGFPTRLVEDILTGATVTGVRHTWTLSDASDDLTIVQEVNAEGVAFEDSVVRVTVCITNDSPADARVGIRFEWDWQIDPDLGGDGPYMGLRPPSPPAEPFLAFEQTYTPPTFDSYDISDTQSPTINPSLYRVGGTVLNPPLGMGPTAPERLQYAAWNPVFNKCFDYTTTGALAGGGDSAVAYYWGATPATAIVLPAGGTYCVTQYVFAFSEVPPQLCQITPDVRAGSGCDVASILIDASRSTSTDCAGRLQFQFTDPTGNVAEPWSYDPYHDAAMSGLWSVDIQCDVDTSCTTNRKVQVEISRTPLFDQVFFRDAASCNQGIELTWQDAVFRDSGSGSYTVYRSEAGCADPNPTRLTNVTGLRHVDLTTTPGTSYYYFVEAEDAQPTALCPAGPANGGAVTRTCVGPITDVADPTVPEGVCYTLRVRHAGDAITADWTLARALLGGEHFHLLKAVNSATSPFTLANPELDLARTFTETDTSSRLQFFDLRVANACEVESADDEPPSLTGDPQPCP